MGKNQKTIITIILIIVVILAGYWLFAGNSKSTNETEQAPVAIDNNVAASSSVQEQGTQGLSATGIKVEDQNPGRIVVVNQVLINNAGWVVIQEDANGAPGNIIGARLFEKGSNSGVIQLLSSMKVGKTYYAVVHADNGDGSFDLKKDAIMKDSSGKEIMTKFAVTQGSDKPNQ